MSHQGLGSEMCETDWPCHSRSQKDWCDHAGPGGFMGHTCRDRDALWQRARDALKPELPSAETVILAIALAGGKLKGHQRFMTKYDMVRLCKAWLKENT